jgi:DNA polymerase-3 subunit epsilon
MREIVFDTETTGIDPNTGDRMVEIGCIELVNRVPTGRTYHAYFNPCRPMPLEAERVHGLTDTFLADKKKFQDHAEELIDFLGDCPLVAHNAQFDFGFLNVELGFCGHPAVDHARMVDTLALARRRHPGAKHSLDALCSRYGVDRSHRVLHGALLDAELLALASATSTRLVQASTLQRPRARTFRPPRPHSPTPAELVRHKAFLETLNSPLWTQ